LETAAQGARNGSSLAALAGFGTQRAPAGNQHLGCRCSKRLSVESCYAQQNASRPAALTPPGPHLHPCPQLRALNIVARLGTYFGCLWWDRVTGHEDTPDRVRLRASQLRDMLTTLGPSFIKAGQVLANRPDIVREDYMNELCVLQVRGVNSWTGSVTLSKSSALVCRASRRGRSLGGAPGRRLESQEAKQPASEQRSRRRRPDQCHMGPLIPPTPTSQQPTAPLQDDVPPFPDEIAFSMLESELRRPLGEVFSSISERPVAAASLGQVGVHPGAPAGVQLASHARYRPAPSPVRTRAPQADGGEHPQADGGEHPPLAVVD
jgi:hypothetical protein